MLAERRAGANGERVAPGGGDTARHLGARVPVVSICIVTHNACDHVRRCLGSIRRHSHVPHELIVVDNASGSETRELLRSQPDLKLTLNGDNLLWAAGINQAIRMADPGSDYLLLLNPDVEVLADNWLEVMLQIFAAEPKVGVVGTAHNYAPAAPMFGWIDGSCFMVRHALMREIGLLDAERFPWAGAPALWCARAWKAGWRYRVVNPKDRLLHHSIGASRREYRSDDRLPAGVFRAVPSLCDIMLECRIDARPVRHPRRQLDRTFAWIRYFGRSMLAPPMMHGVTAGGGAEPAE